MKTNYLFLALLSFSTLFSQQVNWAKSLVLPYGSKGILTDNAGNIYNYGNNFNTYSESLGFTQPYTNQVSYIYKYSPAGVLLSSKTWSTAFCIQKVIYDDNSGFYFAGLFAGNQVIDGISISSIGESDAMVGKMDLNGNVVWIKTLGGHKGDLANALTLNPSKTAITITGGISDSLYVNNAYVEGRTEKSLLMASFNVNGTFLSHKLIDFLSGVNDVNSGIELFTDNAGNYIMHGQREGSYWFNNNPTGPENGRYVFKLDQDYNILWSQFIISGGCYYGYSCGGLGITSNGDAYITSVCSGKYGGNPYVKRMNSVTGQISWTIPSNNDGNYNFSYGAGSNVFVLGVEGANGCPCEGNHGGYSVLKKFDSNNQLQGELRIKNAYLNYITKSTDGTLYVLGSSGYTGSKIGSDSVKGSFLISLADIKCSAVALDTNQYYWRPKLFCDTLTLDAGAGCTNYLWSNGCTDRFLKTTQEGCYSVRLTQNTGCVAYSIGSYAAKKKSPQAGQIVYVSYDNSLHRNVINYQPPYQGVYSGWFYASFKKSSNNLIKTDTSSIFNYPLRFTDTLNWADTSQVNYSLTMMDECGYQSTESVIHKTMYLKVKRENDKMMLSWTKYEGVSYSTFSVLRGANLSDMKIIATLDKSITSFADSLVNQNMIYQIKISTNIDYYIQDVLSNPAGQPIIQSVRQNAMAFINQSVYPNPSDNEFYLKGFSLQRQNLDITIYDIQGSPVYKETIAGVTGEVNRKIGFNASPGIYFIEVSDPDNKFRSKIVKR